MSRVIRFRAWDKNEKRMGYLDYLWNDHWYSTPSHKDGGGVAIWDNTNIVMDRKDIVLMQFTGLLDKNGKEVFKGDVVAHDARIIHQSGLWKSEVYFENGCFQVKCDMVAHLDNEFHIGTVKKNLGLWNMDYIEILGNIYENPELLTHSKAHESA